MQLFRFRRSHSLLQCLTSANLHSKRLSVRNHTCGSKIMSEPTKLIYQQDGDKLLHPATILSIIPVSALPDPDQSFLKDSSDIEHAIITDSTIFYVQGGGQPFDTGTMTSEIPRKNTSIFEVKSVRQPAHGSQILHLGRFSPVGTPPFESGEIVHQHVDAEKRNLYSRFHTAGHILSLAILALVREGVLAPLTESKASHYPDSAAVVFGGAIEGKHKDVIQAKTDEFVKLARPVRIHWWPMEEVREKCSGVTDDFALPEGEVMARVVEMEGLGSYPCGGTHVHDCSQVGKIEVKKISRSKGLTRVSYKVT